MSIFFYKGDTLHQGVEFVPLLAQMVEKVASQAFQVVLINEAVFATNLLLALLSTETQTGTVYKIFIIIILCVLLIIIKPISKYHIHQFYIVQKHEGIGQFLVNSLTTLVSSSY